MRPSRSRRLSDPILTALCATLVLTLALALVAEAGTRSPSDPAGEKGRQANQRIAGLYAEASAIDPSVPGPP
ncbi:MAG: hypothetical protein ACYC6I_04480 [Bacillota bacterium]